MDIILYNIIASLVCILFGYFFGSIPTGIIIGKVFFHRDPRNEGSHNSGGTNVGRLFGKKVGLICIILDMIKAVTPMIIVWVIVKYSGILEFFTNTLGGEMFDAGVHNIYLAALGAMIGHCYPIYVGFKGGKAVATFAGLILGSCWTLAALGLSCFFIVLKISKHVSLSSIITASFMAVISWLLFGLKFVLPEMYQNIFMWGNGNYLVCGWEYATVITVGAILVIARHSSNIKRLKDGTESKIKWMK